MLKIPGLMDYFSGDGSISFDSVVERIKSKTNSQLLQNQLGNHLLYPGTLPQTPVDLHIDLALLQEILTKQPGSYYNQTHQRITIPESLLIRFPDLRQLVWVFVDVLGTTGITGIFLKSEKVGLKGLGTIIKPTITGGSGWATLSVGGRKYETQVGGLLVIPLTENHMDIKFESDSAKLLGKSELITEVIGGEFGLALDMHP